MRCEHVDPATDIQCPNEATRRVILGGFNPFSPGTKGDAMATATVKVCDEHDPDPTKSIPLDAS